jgi:hypothetical protein
MIESLAVRNTTALTRHRIPCELRLRDRRYFILDNRENTQAHGGTNPLLVIESFGNHYKKDSRKGAKHAKEKAASKRKQN